MYGTKLNASQYDGDIIIEKGDVTIIGRLKPGYPRGQNDDPVEQQPIWQIERIESVELLASPEEEEEVPVAENDEQGEQNPSNEPSNEENEETVETSEEEIVATYVTRRKYPYGNEDYKFKISEAFDYPYEYRH